MFLLRLRLFNNEINKSHDLIPLHDIIKLHSWFSLFFIEGPLVEEITCCLLKYTS